MVEGLQEHSSAPVGGLYSAPPKGKGLGPVLGLWQGTPRHLRCHFERKGPLGCGKLWARWSLAREVIFRVQVGRASGHGRLYTDQPCVGLRRARGFTSCEPLIPGVRFAVRS